MTKELILWADVETTGTDAHAGYLLQVAGFLTDTDLNIISEPFNHIIQYTDVDTIKSSANEFVQNMHEQTGLWDKLPDGLPLAEVDELVKNYINRYKDDETVVRLAGNSIRLDLNFMERFLALSYGTLTYRSLDMSAISFFLKEVCGLTDEDFKKKKSHDAVDDVMESLNEARWARSLVLPPL